MNDSPAAATAMPAIIRAQVLQNILCPGCGTGMSLSDDMSIVFCRNSKCAEFGGKAFHRPITYVELVRAQ